MNLETPWHGCKYCQMWSCSPVTRLFHLTSHISRRTVYLVLTQKIRSLYVVAYLVFTKVLPYSYHSAHFGTEEPEAQKDCLYDPLGRTGNFEQNQGRTLTRPWFPLGSSQVYLSIFDNCIIKSLLEMKIPNLLVFKAGLSGLGESVLVLMALAFCPWKSNEGFRW